MAVLTWGKPTLEIGKIGADGSAPTTWDKLTNPQENSTQLTVEKGDKKEAIGEGGEIVDSKYNKNKYSLVAKLFQRKGDVKPIADEDGVILDNYAVRLTPEDTTLEGFVIDKTSVSVVDTWTSEEGTMWEYTFDGLQPKEGKILKPYTAPVTP